MRKSADITPPSGGISAASPNSLVRDGLASAPDIWDPLKYLYDMGFIGFTNKKITPDTAFRQDGVARLTTKSVRFIESGGNPESGIDL